MLKTPQGRARAIEKQRVKAHASLIGAAVTGNKKVGSITNAPLTRPAKAFMRLPQRLAIFRRPRRS